MKRRLVTIGFILTLIWGVLIGLPKFAYAANHLPVMYVQVPQWADDWAVCAVDIPDAKCHWYVKFQTIHLVKDFHGKMHLGLMPMD